MANEFTMSVQAAFTKGNVSRTWPSTKTNITVAGSRATITEQNIGTTREPLNLGDVVPGMMVFRNLDATNYVDIYPNNTDAALVRIKPNETSGPFRLATTTPHAKANVAACDIEFMAVDD